jgi:hypothetical protein
MFTISPVQANDLAAARELDRRREFATMAVYSELDLAGKNDHADSVLKKWLRLLQQLRVGSPINVTPTGETY